MTAPPTPGTPKTAPAQYFPIHSVLFLLRQTAQIAYAANRPLTYGIRTGRHDH